MEIPKIIHYFWDGPDMPYRFIDSWKKLNPGYTLQEWNCRNLPLQTYPKLQTLINYKKFSILSDFIRHWALLEFGGFYLDCDIELIKPLDSLRHIKSFTCIEGPDPIAANSAASGAMRNQRFQKDALERFFYYDFTDIITGAVKVRNKQNLLIPAEIIVSPHMVTNLVEGYKHAPLDTTDLYSIKTYPNGLTTLPKAVFYPYNWNESFSKECIKPETIGIHYWKKSW